MRGYVFPISVRGLLLAAAFTPLAALLIAQDIIRMAPRFAPWSYLLFLMVVPAVFLAWRALKNAFRLGRAHSQVWFGR